MKNKLFWNRKLTPEQIVEMKEKRMNGFTVKELCKEYKISQNTVNYHTNEKYIIGNRLRQKRYALTPKAKEKSRNFLKLHPECYAKSWIRNYLKNKILTIDDVLEVLDEFKMVK